MKKLLILAVFSVLLVSVSFAYADVRVSGTTVSGSSNSSIVNITITDSDGQVIWKKSVPVDETFEITMPRLEDGKYTLSMKHGAIGGEQEVIEFTYTGPAPIGNFELIIELPDEPAEDFGSFATKNRINNFERLMDFIRNSEEVERRLEVIIMKFDDERGISSQDLSEVTRFTPEGLETLEYGIAWTTFRAYNDIIGDARQVLELIENGMSLDAAIDFLGIIPEPEPIPDEEPGPTEEMQMEEIVEEEPELIECEAEICVKECNTLPNCTVIWEPEPEPEELEIPAPFVDPTKDPQSYVDRYNSEPTYKKWFDENYPEYSSIYEAVGLPKPIPEWVRGVFVFWANGEISDAELTSAISFLVDTGVIILKGD
ncbi:MAG: hypothetical protein IIC67_04425 [Thaumarchaeota archaeon]|nr:hypothetical protein [Nitrososphaerota archaeon]